jgi:hypothetical protein
MFNSEAHMRTVLSCLKIVVFLVLFGDLTVAHMGVQNNLSVAVLEAEHPAKIRAVLANPSNKPTRIWKDSNSWGAARWRVLILRNGKLRTLFQDPDQDFTVNLPTFVEIPAGSHLEQNLDLNDGSWRSSDGEQMTLAPGDTAILVYDVPFTQECIKLGVWYGVAANSTVVK